MSENQKGLVTGLELISNWMIYTHWEADESFAFPNTESMRDKMACALVAGEHNLFMCTINVDGTPGNERRALTYNGDEEVPTFDEIMEGEYALWAILAPLKEKNWNLTKDCTGCLITNVPCIDCYCRMFRADNQFKKDAFSEIKGLRQYMKHSRQALRGKQTSIKVMSARDSANEVFPLPEAREFPRDECGALDIDRVIPPSDWMKLLSYEMFKFEVSFSKKFRTLQELVINQIMAQNDKIREKESWRRVDNEIDDIRRRNGNTEAE